MRVIGSRSSSVCNGIDGDVETSDNAWPGCPVEVDHEASRNRRKSHTLKKDRLYTSNSVVALEL
jgi:hypothetical protein